MTNTQLFQHRQPSGWPANVKLVSTGRAGGCSVGTYSSSNLAFHVGDDEYCVRRNRDALKSGCNGAGAIFWLNQIHSSKLVKARSDQAEGEEMAADASWTTDPGLACAVMTADCLPVLVTDRAGSFVAAIHAGWRGMAADILEKAITAFPGEPRDYLCWLGPAIGQNSYEVGPEVATALGGCTSGFASSDGIAVVRKVGSDRYLVDLKRAAEYRLVRKGVRDIHLVDSCTYTDSDRYFSYRRDGTTGRQASLVYLTA
ncbi:MAG: peptidoglycan editing factor PgeF [Pseudomonadota bacterium]